MDKIPNLDELLNYGDDYQYPDLILSDYFINDKDKKKEDNKDNQNNKLQEPNIDEQQNNEEQSEESNIEDQQYDEEQSQEPNIDEQQNNEEQPEKSNIEDQQYNEEQSEESNVEEQQNNEEQSEESNVEEQQNNEEQLQKPNVEEQQNNEEEQSEESNIEDQQYNEGQSQEQNIDEQQNNEEQSQEPNVEEQQNNEEEQLQEQNIDEQPNEEEQPEESDIDDLQDEEEQQEEKEKTENDFDDLINNYDEINDPDYNKDKDRESEKPSDKLNDITSTKTYSVLKKLVSLSYERYEKGTYKYDKKEVVKHYITNQKFKIVNDLISPTFKPDVYVFDLSPSNNDSLEMYVNAISSVAVKNSLIYLTYNDCILRKLTIKKGNAKSIDVAKVANSHIKRYSNFDCTIFDEYQSLYEELREIKDRKIYIFSDFDISSDISKLSQENPEIVWFSTERNNYGTSIYNTFLVREFPSSYVGYYVETAGIEDIEKFVLEKNKNKYKRRSV